MNTRVELYFEDVPVGTRWDAGHFTITEEESLDFARFYDPQPMHVDSDAASRGRFGGLIASGWHTAAMVMRATALVKPFGDTEVLGLGVEELKWPNPVRPGDVIHVETEVVASTPSKSKPDFGIVKMKTTARNQRSEVVMVLSPSCWVPRRPRD